MRTVLAILAAAILLAAQIPISSTGGGSSDLSSGFTGVLPVANGGTGQTTTVGIQTVTTLVSTSGPVTDPGGYSAFQYNNAAGALTFNAPAGVANYQRCYRNATGKSGAITIQMAASNTVDLDGSDGSAAGTLVSTGTLADSICIVSDVANHWYVWSKNGTWTPGS